MPVRTSKGNAFLALIQKPLYTAFWYSVCWITGVNLPRWWKVQVEGQGQGHKSHKTLKTLKLQYLSHFWGASHSRFCMQLLTSHANHMTHVRYVNYHRGVWLIMPNLVLVSFRELGNILWTIQGSHSYLVCWLITYYCKAAWLAKGQGQGHEDHKISHKKIII